MRAIIFLWMVIFPIVFVAIPALEMVGDEREFGLMPVWAFVVWLLGPAAVAIGLKYAGGAKNRTR
jgi:hypothetical protein